jgi:hypothetical protein
MYRKSKIMWPATASLVTLTSILNAADDAQMRNLENRVTALEQRKSANGMINPNGRPLTTNGCGVYFTGDFLYWHAEETGLGYVVKNNDSGDWVSNGKLKTPNFGWDPGFRIGVGFDLAHDGWDIYTAWTWMQSSATDTISAPAGGNLFPTFMNFQTINQSGTVSSAYEKWKTKLNVIDLELGRQFFVSKWLTLRPFFGLRTAWVYQSYHLSYNGEFDTLFPTLVSDRIGTLSTPNNSNHYWGLGLRAGLNTQWGLGAGFSLYGDAALSLLWGTFRVKESECFLENGAAAGENMLDLKKHESATRPITDLAAGIRWDTHFCDGRYYFRIQAGWEQHIFFSQNQFDRVVEDDVPGITVTNQGDLSYNGIAVGFRFDF